MQRQPEFYELLLPQHASQFARTNAFRLYERISPVRENEQKHSKLVWMYKNCMLLSQNLYLFVAAIQENEVKTLFLV